MDRVGLPTHSPRLKVIPWIDENIDPFKGNWLARTMLIAQDAKRKAEGKKPGVRERGKEYNHSSYCDLIITGLAGLRPRAVVVYGASHELLTGPALALDENGNGRVNHLVHHLQHPVDLGARGDDLVIGVLEVRSIGRRGHGHRLLEAPHSTHHLFPQLGGHLFQFGFGIVPFSSQFLCNYFPNSYHQKGIHCPKHCRVSAINQLP